MRTSDDDCTGGAAAYTNTEYSNAKTKALTTLSAAELNVGDEHKGPANTTAGGGSIDTTNSAKIVIRKGRSVCASGLRALRNPETSISADMAWKMNLLHDGVGASLVQV
jgi:hypothetical protein